MFVKGGGEGGGGGEEERGVEDQCVFFGPFSIGLFQIMWTRLIYTCPTSFSKIIISYDYFKIIFAMLSSFNCHVFQKFTI